MRKVLVLVALTLLLAPAGARAADCTQTSVGFTPVDDLAAGTYQGMQGGLYPGGSNERPGAHTNQGMALSGLVLPRNAAGLPDPVAGKIVFLSIGMSNTRNESSALAPKIAADPLRDPAVVFVNGAQGGMDAEQTKSITSPYWSFVDQQLTAAGATFAQVQAVWLKQAIAGINKAFPADAQQLQADLGAIVQILRVKFPNLNLVYLSSRIYAGYASTSLNPEPYAYQSAFAVKWLIQSQIEGPGVAAFPVEAPGTPWLSWAAYLWADGLSPRSDGLTYSCTDFNSDGTHPSAAGSAKVADQLMGWLHSDPTTKLWYEG